MAGEARDQGGDRPGGRARLIEWRAVVTNVSWRAVGVLAIMTMALVAGCGSGGSSSAAGAGTAGPTPTASASRAAVGYWTRDRLLAARPSRNWTSPSSPAATPSGHAPVIPAPRVGALFSHSASGDHFCTASVVDSPGHELLVTAAHCIYAGKSGYDQDIVFIPAYQDGAEPFGVWTPSKLLVDPQWASSSDPDYDVGFVVLRPNDGKTIQDVLGANQMGFNAGYSHLVRVTGYPSTADAPVTCMNRTAEQSPTQLRFDCGGYFAGTSGSPWLTKFDLRTRTGTIVGVIGGYQQGGDTPSISYSVYLNNSIRALYQQAEALG
jgi:V8-like Glu-specific endopeptidase